MTIQKQRVTCLDCGKVCDVELVVDAPVSVAIASMKAARCAHCGSGNLGLGGSYDDAPPLTAPVEHRAAWWKERGEIGRSSKTIYAAFAGSRPSEPDIPYDPDDFRRCKLLLDLIPEWRQNIGRVSEVYPWYKPFADAWDEMDRLYAEEAPKKRCPKLYALMKGLEKQSMEIRRAK